MVTSVGVRASAASWHLPCVERCGAAFVGDARGSEISTHQRSNFDDDLIFVAGGLASIIGRRMGHHE
eukprot:2158598-Pyramimonas_sp.AAC.1